MGGALLDADYLVLLGVHYLMESALLGVDYCPTGSALLGMHYYPGRALLGARYCLMGSALFGARWKEGSQRELLGRKNCCRHYCYSQGGVDLKRISLAKMFSCAILSLLICGRRIMVITQASQACDAGSIPVARSI